MRAAPAVEARLADGRALRWLIVLLHLVAMAALLAWAAGWTLPARLRESPLHLPWTAWLLAAIGLLLAGALGNWQARRLLPGRSQRLRWDGGHWQWLVDGQICALDRVCVQIDLGRHVLMRLHAVANPRLGHWVVASAHAAGRDWHGLRVALHYHAGALPDLAAHGDGAEPGR